MRRGACPAPDPPRSPRSQCPQASAAQTAPSGSAPARSARGLTLACRHPAEDARSDARGDRCRHGALGARAARHARTRGRRRSLTERRRRCVHKPTPLRLATSTRSRDIKNLDREIIENKQVVAALAVRAAPPAPTPAKPPFRNIAHRQHSCRASSAVEARSPRHGGFSSSTMSRLATTRPIGGCTRPRNSSTRAAGRWKPITSSRPTPSRSCKRRAPRWRPNSRSRSNRSRCDRAGSS